MYLEKKYFLVACGWIADKLSKEEQNEEFVKTWQSQNREELRARLMGRHKSVVELEEKVGVKKRKKVDAKYTIVRTNITSSMKYSQESGTLALTTIKGSRTESRLADTISRLTNSKKDVPSNIFLKSEFRGLILPNYSVAHDAKYTAKYPFCNVKPESKGKLLTDATCVQLKQASTHMGFPFPEHSGIACCPLNKPLSETLNLTGSPLATKIWQKNSPKDQKLAEKMKAIERERDVRVSVTINQHFLGVEGNDTETRTKIWKARFKSWIFADEAYGGVEL